MLVILAIYLRISNGIKEMDGFRQTFNLSLTLDNNLSLTSCSSTDDEETSAILVSAVKVSTSYFKIFLFIFVLRGVHKYVPVLTNITHLSISRRKKC